MMAAEPAATTAQMIAQALREQILSGALPPNTRVTQRDLAARFGHSPMPARDAVKILLAEGLVVQEGSKTIVVAPVNLESFAEIMEMRQLLEPHALQLSMPWLSAEDIAEARAAIALSGTTEDDRQIVENHWSFHRAIYKRADRPRLLSLIEQQHNLLIRYLMPNWARLGVLANWAEDERELLKLIEQHRTDEAVEWLRNDLGDAAQRVLQPSRQ